MLWVYERRRNAREFPSRNVGGKKSVCFFFPKTLRLLPVLIQIYCCGVKQRTMFRTHWVFTDWLSAWYIIQHLPSFTAAFWGQDTTLFQRRKKGLKFHHSAGNVGGLGGCWFSVHPSITTCVPEKGTIPVGCSAMPGCTSLNVWIQCIQAGDFTTNSERQQTTEGVQA